MDYPKALLLFSILCLPFTGFSSEWVTKRSRLKSSVHLPVESHRITVSLPIQTAFKRLFEGTYDSNMEPIMIPLPKNPDEQIDKILKFTKKGYENKIVELWYSKQFSLSQKNAQISLILKQEHRELFDWTLISQLYQFTHYKLTIKDIKNPKYTHELQKLSQQVSLFLNSELKSDLRNALLTRESLDVESTLFPPFAKKWVRNFSPFRGPNCFHAVLSFQNQEISTSPFINIKREKNHHPSMINNDEILWYVQQNFYEVDPRKSQLYYGDILLFFDLPEENPKSISYRWLKHASTYLLSGYTFSKASKSPNSPYTIKALDDEWMTWMRLCQNMAVKVFRQNGKNVTRRPPKSLIDWLY